MEPFSENQLSKFRVFKKVNVKSKAKLSKQFLHHSKGEGPSPSAPLNTPLRFPL